MDGKSEFHSHENYGLFLKKLLVANVVPCANHPTSHFLNTVKPVPAGEGHFYLNLHMEKTKSKPKEKLTAATADKISMAMTYYLDSEEPSPPKPPQTTAAPPAPPATSCAKKETAAVPKKPRVVKPNVSGNLSAAAAAAMSMLNNTKPKGPSTTKRQTVSKSNPPRVASKQIRKMTERSKYQPPPTPDKYVPPTFLRKAGPGASTRSKSATAIRPNNGGESASPDKTEVAGSRLYARAKQQQRSIKDKQKEKVGCPFNFSLPVFVSPSQPPPTPQPYKCTFAPNFETSSKSRGSTDRKVGEFTTGMTESASGQERFDCLYRDAQAKLERKKGLIAREKRNPSGCTFSPAIESTKKHRSRDQTKGIQRMKNLYSDGKKIKTKLEMKKAETAQTEAPNFSPQITRKAKNMDKYRSSATKRFSDRLYRDERSKFDHLANKKKELETEGCTFQPKITRSRSAPKSRPSWAVEDEGEKGVAERLYKYNSKIAAKHAVLLEEKEQQIEKETPFKPKLATLQYHEARNQRVSSRKKFDVERLMNQGGVQEKAARREALLRAEAKLLTFTPKIPKRRATSAPKSRPSWMNENEDTSNGNNGRKRTVEVYDRLYADRFYADEERMVAKEEQFMRDMRDCTFSPSIPLKRHEKSKVSSNTPVWERLYDDKMSIALLREEIKVQKELTGCTFQPATSTSSNRSAKINRMAATHGSSINEPVHERLYKAEDAKYKLLEMEKKRMELR